jgi:hypothetical protein
LNRAKLDSLYEGIVHEIFSSRRQNNASGIIFIMPEALFEIRMSSNSPTSGIVQATHTEKMRFLKK